MVQPAEDSRAWPYIIGLTLSGDHLPAGETLCDFPLLVVLRKQYLRTVEHHGHVAHADGCDFRFTSADGTMTLDFEIERYDPLQGMLIAWVRLPRVTGGADVYFTLAYGNPVAVPRSTGWQVWDRHFEAVLHFNGSTGTPVRDSTALRRDAGGAVIAMSREALINGAAVFDGEPDHAVPSLRAMRDWPWRRAFTVEAWVRPRSFAARLQVTVARWELRPAPLLSAYDASRTSEMDLGGYAGGAFDGRYIYFAPWHDRTRYHGKVLRFDTTRSPDCAEAWQAHDAGAVDGLETRGYRGAVFDGAYVYFVPERDDRGGHGRVLRYDTRQPFHAPAAWNAHDPGLNCGCRGGGFDGRFLYLASGSDDRGGVCGKVIRYDTQAPFQQRKSWSIFDARAVFGGDLGDFAGVIFDGYHVHFIPHASGVILRHDVSADFLRAESWSIYDAAGQGLAGCLGAAFDGRYLYFAPNARRRIIRCDTSLPPADPSAWQVRHMDDLPDLKHWGFSGGLFDGRYIHFIPAAGERPSQPADFHGQLLSLDTLGDFAAPAAWQVLDTPVLTGRPTIGYHGAIFDGNRFYCVPWHDGATYRAESRVEGHGMVLAGETTQPGSAFLLRCSGSVHQTGFSAGPAGPAFTIRTDDGCFTAASAAALTEDWHHLAGVFNGQCVRLFVDGRLVDERPARGLVDGAGSLPVCLGGLPGGGRLAGLLDECRISSVARPAAWLRLSHENQRAPESFLAVTPESGPDDD